MKTVCVSVPSVLNLFLSSQPPTEETEMDAEVSSTQRAFRDTFAAACRISLTDYPFPFKIFQKHFPLGYLLVYGCG